MNLSPADIINLPITEKERNHNSRSRLGRHIYTSYFFILFKSKPIQIQFEWLHRRGIAFDDCETAVPSSSISRLASSQWSVLTVEEQEAWEERANII